MSENLDLVRSIYADWERGDFSHVEWAHPEIEFVVADGPDPGSWIGRRAAGRAWRDFLGTFEDYRVTAEEHRELEDGQVLVSALIGGRGKASGIQVSEADRRGANLFQLRDGAVRRLILYWDRDRALADLGLEDG